MTDNLKIRPYEELNPKNVLRWILMKEVTHKNSSCLFCITANSKIHRVITENIVQ